MHSSGLRCSHNSELDTKIPRAKLPKRALPDCLRKKLKGVKVEETNDSANDVNVYAAGSGVLAPVGSAPDGTFLKRGSGIPMSLRASALAQRRGDAANARATIYRAKLVNGNVQRSEQRDSIRFAKAEQKKAEMRSMMRNGGDGTDKSQRSKSNSSFTALPPINQKNKYDNSNNFNGPDLRKQKQTSNSLTRKNSNNNSSSNIISSNKNGNKKVSSISLTQQLESYLSSGLTPRLVSDGEALLLSKKMSKPKYQVKFELVKDALLIMNKVNEAYGKKMGVEGNEVYGPGDVGYIDSFFGPPISHRAASAWIDAYLTDNDIVGKIDVKWASSSNSDNGGDNGDAQVGSRYDDKEDKVKVIVSESFPGIHRAFGVQMFAHHEIATRGMRMLNDVHQPWNTDRKKHGLTSLGSRESGATEEGLASVHSVLGCNDPSHRYLWNTAVLYYACAMGDSMTFSELYDHLSTWISDKPRRFNICVRVKRGSCISGAGDGSTGLKRENSVGASGQCQCYFEGAHAFLTRVVADPMFDIRELYYGKVCLKDLDRASSMADKEYILTPQFMGGIDGTVEAYNAYVEELKEVALLNGICH